MSFKTTITIILPIFLACMLVGCKSTPVPPNILWLMTDEHRADATGYSGTPWAYTPNLDRLANEGVVFLNAYTQAPVCTPARVSILTGKYCSQSGVWRNIGNHPLQFDLLTDIFKEAGYRSATFGKQHYGGPKRAFDKEASLVISKYVDCYGYDEQYDEELHDVVKYPKTWVLGGRFPEPAEKSREAECVRGAIQWLREGSREQPFLLRLSFSAPHTPVVPPVPFDTLINEEDIKMPKEADPSSKVCYLYWYPETIKSGVKILTPVETRSMLPTLLELAGLEPPRELSDISLAASIIQGKEPPVSKPVFSEMSFGFDPKHPDNRVVMVRDGDWKLSYCVDARAEKGELVNLREDPYEQKNLFGLEETKVVQEKLIGLIDEHLRGTEKPFRNVAVLDKLLRDEAGHVACPSCKRQKVRDMTNPETAPDWTEGLKKCFSCGHCGTRFGLLADDG